MIMVAPSLCRDHLGMVRRHSVSGVRFSDGERFREGASDVLPVYVPCIVLLKAYSIGEQGLSMVLAADSCGVGITLVEHIV